MVEMRQSNKCGGVVTDEIFNLPVGFGASPWVSIPCLVHGNQPSLLIPFTNTLNKKKAKNQEMRFYSRKIVSYCLALLTQKPGLKEADAEPIPLIDSDKINMLKQGKRNVEKKNRTAWTHIWILALGNVDLEISAKRGANRTKPIVSVYWSSRSFHRKWPPNQTQNKSTKVDPIMSSRTSKTLTKSPYPMLLCISKHSFRRLKGQVMPMAGVISGLVRAKGKTKSNPLARLKVRIFSKSAVGF